MNEKLIKKCLILLIVAITVSCNSETNYILNENFDRNVLGWVEESTDYHNAIIDSGVYFLSSLDTSATSFLSSTGTLDKSYLIGLPTKYEISSKITLISNDLEDANFGLFLYGASLQYSFVIYKSGKIEVLEYDYNSDKQLVLFSAESELSIENEVSFKIIVDNSKFKFFIDEYEIGESEFRVRSWQELRIFTTKQSKIAIDFLRIQEISQ